jgi:hypothetical protein
MTSSDEADIAGEDKARDDDHEFLVTTGTLKSSERRWSMHEQQFETPATKQFSQAQLSQRLCDESSQRHDLMQQRVGTQPKREDSDSHSNTLSQDDDSEKEVNDKHEQQE